MANGPSSSSVQAGTSISGKTATTVHRWGEYNVMTVHCCGNLSPLSLWQCRLGYIPIKRCYLVCICALYVGIRGWRAVRKRQSLTPWESGLLLGSALMVHIANIPRLYIGEKSCCYCLFNLCSTLWSGSGESVSYKIPAVRISLVCMLQVVTLLSSTTKPTATFPQFPSHFLCNASELWGNGKIQIGWLCSDLAVRLK